MRNRAPVLVLIGCLALSAALIIWSGRGLTFFFDEWQLLLPARPLAPSTLLDPHNGQVSLMSSAIYGLLLETVGMTSQLPYRLVAVAASLACVTLLFLLVRRRTDPWLALVFIVPVLGLGVAWEALLLALSMNFLIGVATGLGMLLALESRSRRGDGLACFLLCCSLSSGGIGLAFLAGALVDVIVRREFRRAWIPGIPAALYGIWSLGFGDDDSPASVDNALGLPDYLCKATAAAVRSVTGLATDLFPAGPAIYLSVLLFALFIAAIVWRLFIARQPFSDRILVVSGVLLAFWVLGGLALGEGRAPDASRYQYPSTILLILLAACLLDGLDRPNWLPAALLPLALLSLGLNTSQFGDGRDFLLRQTEITRAAIGQVEIEDPVPDFLLTEQVTGSPYQRLIDTDAYLRAEKRFGSPAYSPEEIQRSGPDGRKAAEGVALAAALAREYSR
ncbi:MAG: hypothetical protein KDB52_05300 [Solirubrobacterales bacterium]|nr:hypothetical protein [Solirubrobacterales bacterium]